MSHIHADQFADRFVALVLSGRGLPKQELDRHILFIGATLGLDPDRRYSEAELNAELLQWTTRFGGSSDLDHVSLRRFLVDEGYVQRDRAGSWYELTTTGWPYSFDPAIKLLDLQALIDEARRERELRKQQYLSRSEG